MNSASHASRVASALLVLSAVLQCAAETSSGIPLAECSAFRESLGRAVGAGAANSRQWQFPAGYRRVPGECWSSEEWKCFRDPGREHLPSPLLLQRLHQYRRHFEKCAHLEGPAKLRATLLHGRAPKCKYVFWTHPYGGVGNRVINFISAFAHALLTNRILLVDGQTEAFVDLFCNPFHNTPWVLPGMDQVFAKFRGSQTNYSSCATNYASTNRGRRPIALLWWTLHHQDLSRYFCSDFHDWVDSVPVLVGGGNQYNLPALYHVPRFNRVLHWLFPTGAIFATLLPLLLKPTNKVWEKTTHMLMRMAPQRGVSVGVQFRSYGKRSSLSQNSAKTLARCLVRLLNTSAEPNDGAMDSVLPLAAWQGRGLPLRSPGPTSPVFLGPSVVGSPHAAPEANVEATGVQVGAAVFLATMDQQFSTDVAQELAAAGVPAEVHVLTLDHEQKTGEIDADARALSEILMLALISRVLFSTPWSTFGYTMSGYASASPHFLDSTCTRASLEPCFHQSPANVSCCHGQVVHVLGSIPEVTSCRDSFPDRTGSSVDDGTPFEPLITLNHTR